MSASVAPRRSLERLLLALSLFAFAVIATRNAWLCDDAFITFRSVDHLANGFGPRFNVAERVQAYTHPLWMALLSLTAAPLRDFSVAPLVLSLGLSVTAVVVLALRLASNAGAAIVAVALLGFSRAFVDYSTSGLENPLSHLLLVCFAVVHFDAGARRSEKARLMGCVAIAGLGMLCRLDTALLYGPALLAAWWPQRSLKNAGLALLALLPLLLWEATSLVYYGFAFPNTAYAKLGAGLPASALVTQGFAYLRAGFFFDPITLLAIGAGLGIGAVRRGRDGMLALGALLYLAYIVRIGGDFMLGRHLSLPLLASVIAIARALPPRPVVTACAIATVCALGLLAPRPTVFSDAWMLRGEAIFERDGVKDERAVYAPYTAPWNGLPQREHPWAEQGRALARRGATVVPRAAIGLFAFHAGPQVHVVDANALSDALLARLPARERGASGWRIGHQTRDLPDGYLASLESGENQIVDPEIARLYDALLIVTRGEIWSQERFAAIGRFATGRFAIGQCPIETGAAE